MRKRTGIRLAAGNSEEDLVFIKSMRRPSYESLKTPARIVDLFSGAGGLTLGAAECLRRYGRGIDVRLAVERDTSIWPIYKANFPQVSDQSPSDIRTWFDSPVGSKLSLAERRARKRTGSVELRLGRATVSGAFRAKQSHAGRRSKK